MSASLHRPRLPARRRAAATPGRQPALPRRALLRPRSPGLAEPAAGAEQALARPRRQQGDGRRAPALPRGRAFTNDRRGGGAGGARRRRAGPHAHLPRRRLRRATYLRQLAAAAAEGAAALAGLDISKWAGERRRSGTFRTPAARQAPPRAPPGSSAATPACRLLPGTLRPRAVHVRLSGPLNSPACCAAVASCCGSTPAPITCASCARSSIPPSSPNAQPAAAHRPASSAPHGHPALPDPRDLCRRHADLLAMTSHPTAPSEGCACAAALTALTMTVDGAGALPAPDGLNRRRRPLYPRRRHSPTATAITGIRPFAVAAKMNAR